MLSLASQCVFQKFAFVFINLFCYTTKHLMTGPLGDSKFCIPSNLNVTLDFVSRNSEILGKQNSLFPSGPLIRGPYISVRVRDRVRVRLFNSSLQASHYHITHPSHPISKPSLPKTSMKSEGSGNDSGLEFKTRTGTGYRTRTNLVMFSQLINKWISKRFQVSTGLFQVVNNLLKSGVPFLTTASRTLSKCLKMTEKTFFL